MLTLEKQKTQSGQALVEYVLLLVVAIALILGLSYQFYRPLGSWVENQMGPYLECLLDVGELPSLGAEAEGDCAQSYHPFGDGKNLAALDAGKRRQSSRSQSETGKKEKTNPSGSDFGASSSGGRGRDRSIQLGASRGADSAIGEGSSETMTEKLPASQFHKLRFSGNEGRSSGSATSYTTELVERYSQGIQRAKRKENQSFKAGTIDQGEGSGKAQKLLIKPSERKIATEEVDEPWSFAKYIKFALIILIIIAIILFLAGQLSQISKSMEK